jgi:Endosomal/lysosomal potassium channel TMEM175
MLKGRLEAFTDGVIAVIITGMVLEMTAPPGADLAALASTLPALPTSSSGGITTTTCFRRASGSMAGPYGGICSYCLAFARSLCDPVDG